MIAGGGTKQVDKPWGNYQLLHTEQGFQVKRILVNSKCRLSLQKHARRAEKWTVVQGSGVAVLEGREIPVSAGSTVDVGVGETHRMWNTGKTPLVFIEVQIGDYLGEDDIVRIEDDYKRA